MQTASEHTQKLAQHFWIGREQTPLCVLSHSVVSLCGPRYYSPPASSVHGILQARILEWAAIPFSTSVCSVQSLSHVQLFATPWTAAPQASLSITNSRSLLKPMSIESVIPSHHLILCHPLLLPSIVPSIRVFSKELALCIRRPKYWSFSFNISPSNEHSD